MTATKLSVNRLIFGTFLLTSLATSFTNIAMGEDLSASKTLDAMEQKATELVNNVSGNQEAGKFVSDGSPVFIEKLGVKITPKAGWEVIKDHPSLSLVLQEPAPEKVEYDVAIYQRNITVAAVRQPSPVDEKRAEQLKEELMNTLGKEGSVSDYQVLADHKFFDYRGKNDGLVMFSTFQSGEFSLMQMHVLISGDKNQLILTYTDLKDRFSVPETYEMAWNTMINAEVTGVPPSRYGNLILIGAIAGFVLLSLIMLIVLRRRSIRNQYQAFADSVYDEDQGASANFSFESKSAEKASKASHKGDMDFPMTQSGVWNLHAPEERGEFSAKKSGDEEGGLSIVTSF